MKKGLKLLIFELVGVVLLFFIWWIISISLNNALIPNPIDTFKYLFTTLMPSIYFWKNFGLSMLRLVLALLISFALAFLFGILSGLFAPVRGLLKPFVTLFRTIPVIIVIFIVFIFFRSIFAPYIVAFLMIFPLVYEAISKNLSQTDASIMNSLRVDGGYNMRGLFRVRLPLIKEQIFVAVFQSLGLGLKTIVMAEALTGDTKLGGLGRLLKQFQLDSDITGIFALAVVLLLVILLFDGIVYLIKRFTIDKEPEPNY